MGLGSPYPMGIYPLPTLVAPIFLVVLVGEPVGWVWPKKRNILSQIHVGSTPLKCRRKVVGVRATTMVVRAWRSWGQQLRCVVERQHRPLGREEATDTRRRGVAAMALRQGDATPTDARAWRRSYDGRACAIAPVSSCRHYYRMRHWSMSKMAKNLGHFAARS